MWEWTASPWTASHARTDIEAEAAPSCCAPAERTETTRFVTKEAHICAHPATATVTGRPLGKATPSAAPLGTWVSAAQPIREPEPSHLGREVDFFVF